MKITRKIQLTAAAVIVNGALALTVLTPSTALAACLPYSIQVCDYSVCQVNGACPAAKPGCAFLERTQGCGYCIGYDCTCQGYSYTCYYGP